MNESINMDIRLKLQAADICADELSLLESILPEIILAMMQAEELHVDD